MSSGKYPGIWFDAIKGGSGIYINPFLVTEEISKKPIYTNVLDSFEFIINTSLIHCTVTRSAGY